MSSIFEGGVKKMNELTQKAEAIKVFMNSFIDSKNPEQMKELLRQTEKLITSMRDKINALEDSAE